MRRPLILLVTILLTSVGLSVVAPAASADTRDFAVQASADDAEQGSSGTSLSSSDLELVYDSGQQIVGLRFPGVSVPKGATINRAYVQFTADKSSSGAVSLTVRGQKGNAAAFTRASTSVGSNRTMTAASAAWQPAAWSSGNRGAAQQTSELKAVVQEIVNGDWAPGYALALVISNTGTGTASRVARSFDGQSSAAPALHLEWTTGGTPPPPPPPAAACADKVDNDGDGKIDHLADPGCTSATDTNEADPVAPPPPGAVPTPATYGFPDCFAGRNVVRPYPAGTVRTSKTQWDNPPDDTTYDLTRVFSTAQPSTSHPFSFGTGSDNLGAGDRTCLVGGELRDQFGSPPPGTWEYYHDDVNAGCVKGVAYGWYQILNTVCRGVEDGFRPQEPGVNANNARFVISDTYLANIFDDCIENDYTVGGVVMDSLWESCYTGVSERPSSDRCWNTPPSEQLILDHLLLGLRPMRHDDGTTGYGRLFKWEKCTQNTANQLVLKCSTFLVPGARLDGGADGMEIPAGTIVDDGLPQRPDHDRVAGGGTRTRVICVVCRSEWSRTRATGTRRSRAGSPGTACSPRGAGIRGQRTARRPDARPPGLPQADARVGEAGLSGSTPCGGGLRDPDAVQHVTTRIRCPQLGPAGRVDRPRQLRSAGEPRLRRQTSAVPGRATGEIAQAPVRACSLHADAVVDDAQCQHALGDGDGHAGRVGVGVPRDVGQRLSRTAVNRSLTTSSRRSSSRPGTRTVAGPGSAAVRTATSLRSRAATPRLGWSSRAGEMRPHMLAAAVDQPAVSVAQPVHQVQPEPAQDRIPPDGWSRRTLGCGVTDIDEPTGRGERDGHPRRRAAVPQGVGGELFHHQQQLLDVVVIGVGRHQPRGGRRAELFAERRQVGRGLRLARPRPGRVRALNRGRTLRPRRLGHALLQGVMAVADTRAVRVPDRQSLLHVLSTGSVLLRRHRERTPPRVGDTWNRNAIASSAFDPRGGVAPR